MVVASHQPPRRRNRARHGRRRRAAREHGRWALASLAVVVLAWLAATVGLRVLYAGKVLPGTHIAGVSLAGSSESDVRRRLAAAPGSGVTLTHGQTRLRVPGTAAGLDLAASAERAMAAGREGPLRGLWGTLSSLIASRDLEPVYASEGAARRVVAAASRMVDRPAFPGALSIDGSTLRASTRPPHPGRAVDRRRTVAALMAALRRGQGGNVAMIVRPRQSVAPAAVDAVRYRAQRYLATGLRITAGDQSFPVTPRQLAPVLGLEPVERAARPRVRLGVRTASLARLVDAIAARARRDPIDARIVAPAPTPLLDDQLETTWAPRRARVRVRPSHPGRAIDIEVAMAAVATAIRRNRREVRLPVRRLSARIPTAAARKVRSLIGTFTTYFSCCEPRVTNIRLIADAVDGTVVAPGERFSLNATAGPRTRAKGYVPAPFIADGKLEQSVGGGVSQMSTTLYNAAYFAGLPIDTHMPHTFYISRYPPGRESTLNYPDIDLAWTNDTRAPVLVRAAATPTSVSVSLYGDNQGRRVRAEPGRRHPLPGRDFAITVTRTITHPDGRVSTERDTTTYDLPPPP